MEKKREYGRSEDGVMRVLVTGASGQLGAYLIDRLVRERQQVVGWSGREPGIRGGVELVPVDLTDSAATARALQAADPDVIIHTAARSRAEEVRADPSGAWEINVAATRRLAEWCAARQRRLVTTSTDLVFDGTRAWNREDDPAVPVLEYGRTKRAAESAALGVPGGLVARLSLLFGPSRSGRQVYYDRTIAALGRGEPQTFFVDEFRTPLDLMTAADALAGLAASEARGLVHVGGSERMSRFELIRRVAAALGLDISLVQGNRQSDAPSAEPRPADVSLDTERLVSVLPGLRRPTIEQAVAALHDGEVAGK
jgi:dTDP-4-dehydrorhamnose reductase